MCACEAHYTRGATCTCKCTHGRPLLPSRAEPKEQYWVTERALGFEPTNEQMKFLNSLLDDEDHEYVLIGCDPQGHYILKMILKEN